MELIRLKRLLALTGGALGLACAGALLAIVTLLVVRTGTGADPADAFTSTELIPESLQGIVEWRADAPDLDRRLEPLTREAVAAAWLLAAAERELESDGLVSASSHELRVGFYSLDGQIVGLTGESLITSLVSEVPIGLSEAYEAVLILTDGRWQLDQLVRTGAILTKS